MAKQAEKVVSASAVKAGEDAPKPTHRPTVTVVCKIPNGMILQLCEPMTQVETMFGGGERTFTQMHPVGDKVRVHGPAVPFGARAEYDIKGGFAVTEGVDAEFWERWLAQHKNDLSVVNKQIYANEDSSYAVDWAKDHKSVTSGMQPLVPDTDSRMPKRGKFKIETEEEWAKRNRRAAA